MPRAEWDATPLFAVPARTGQECVITTDDMHTIAVEIFALAGEDPSTAECGAHSFRIGGATDIREVLGVERGRVVVTDRGRWCDSDIGFIYARVSSDEQLHASRNMMLANGRDLERLFHGWSQPARRR